MPPPGGTERRQASPKASREFPCWRAKMARNPKPWFREERNAWFVTIQGHRHNLGPDKAAADRRFHELMAQKPEPVPKEKPNVLTVAEVLDKYL
jgi:hypothetical protein